MNLDALHRANGRGVLTITGGGTGALGRLLAVPGASRTVLDARIPYSLGALSETLGRAPDQATSAATARALAMVAFQHARRLDIEATFGLGATAALATNREKAGDHRIHVALQTPGTSYLWSLTFDKGRRSREDEEALCEQLILHALFIAKRLHQEEPTLPLGTGDKLVSDHVPGDPAWQGLILGSAVSVPQGVRASRSAALFPGAFNPLHEGHRAMAEVAAICADWPVATSVVMGSSLGGFYATAWAQRWGCRAVLLNPAVHPQDHGDVLVGHFPMWHDPSESLCFEAAYLDELAAIEPPHLSHPQRLLTLVARGDEVLDATLLERHYVHTQLHAFDGGDHA